MAEQISPPEFPVARRGYRRSAVDKFVHSLVVRLEAVEEERRQLRERMSELGLAPGQDLKAEIEQVSSDIEQVLLAARDAAESMRMRAADDAAQWLEEAKIQARLDVEGAQRDAIALRRDAWDTGSELLLQAEATAARLIREAEEESLLIQAHAEQEASRLITSARRESEEERRAARFEAERIVSVAGAEGKALVEAAQREAEAIQQRVRALERRRSELMHELETTRAALAQLEEEIEARRRGPKAATEELQAGVRVLPRHPEPEPEPEPAATEASSPWWQADTIRVVPQGEEMPHVPVDVGEMVAEVRELHRDEDATAEPAERGDGPESESADEVASGEGAGEPEPEPVPVVAAESAEVVGSNGDKADDDDRRSLVAGLFAALRDNSADAAEEDAAKSPEPAETAESGPPEPPTTLATLDPLDLRDRLLLPVVNAAVRNVKRTLVGLQNEVLDTLRTEGDGWRPDQDVFAEPLAEDLTELAHDAYVAGMAAVSELTGLADLEGKAEEPPDPTDEVAAALAADITAAVEQAEGSGPRARNSAVSKVIRLWRADDAERRIRVAGMSAFHQGVVSAARVAGLSIEGVASGPPCAKCPAGQRWAPTEPPPAGAVIPPAFSTCACTLTPAR